jgi:hypothetical protein
MYPGSRHTFQGSADIHEENIVDTRKALATLIALSLVAAACGDDDTGMTTQPPAATTTAAATTTVPAPPPTPAPTTTAAPTTTLTTTTTTTTTAAPTTTAPPFNGNTDPKESAMAGAPSARLVDVRTGSHPGFTRVVWEMDGSDGTPAYQVGYAPGPFVNIGDFTIPVTGTAFLHVIFFPGMRHDITDPDDIILTYLGPEVINVGVGSVQQVVFIEDFEANMEWAIGLTGQQAFKVFTLENPTRLVIDIED